MGFALHPSGMVWILAADYTSSQPYTLLAKDETTGASVVSFNLGLAQSDYVGLPSVLPDGNLYLPVETGPDSNQAPNALKVLRVQPDGTTLWRTVPTTVQCYFRDGIDPHEVLPDNSGGFLVTWAIFRTSNCSGAAQSTRVSHFDANGSFLSEAVAPGQHLQSYFNDQGGDAVLTENYVYFVGPTGSGLRVAGVNVSTGSVDVTYTCQAKAGCTIVSAADGDQFVVQDGATNLVTLTPGASPVTQTVNAPAGTVLGDYDFFDPTGVFAGDVPSVVEQFYASFSSSGSIGVERFGGAPALSGTLSGGAIITGQIIGPLAFWYSLAQKGQRKSAVPDPIEQRDSEIRERQHGRETDCQGLASLVGRFALWAFHDSDVSDNLGVLVPIGDPSVRIANSFGIAIKGTTRFAYLQQDGLLSGFKYQYQDIHPDEDQSHHFAAFFQVGFRAGYTTGVAATIYHEMSLVLNQGDINLGIAAARMAADFKAGRITKPGLRTSVLGLCK